MTDASTWSTGGPGGRRGRGEPGRADTYRADRTEVPFAPLPGVMASVLDAVERLNRYPDPSGAGLAEALARRFSVPSTHVVVGPGGAAVTQMLLRAAVGPGDEVVCSGPSPGASALLERSGARLVEVPFAGPVQDLDALAAAVTGRTRVVVVGSPNDLTGTTMSHRSLLDFLDMMPPGVLVLVDERYREFVTDAGGAGADAGESVADGVGLARGRSNVSVVRTFSHAYGLAALRVGFALAAPRLADAARRAALPFAVSGPAQIAATVSLAAQSELDHRVRVLGRERDRMARALRAQGWEVPMSQANFLWLPLGPATEDFGRACAQLHVVVREFPGNGVRVTVGEREANDMVLFVASRFAGRRPFGA
ncbi:aminotransferase class I/II-fold pyridoxal phosphate-dependent enzyme [Streptomyces sp. NPDC001668]|uniref:aminotransferase class I/II-fold pyridoxal phosphate-dependent enzyme n=1 Tax=unclassified Streptomyces TaxID=2593676 RepID=UPI00367D6D51